MFLVSEINLIQFSEELMMHKKRRQLGWINPNLSSETKGWVEFHFAYSSITLGRTKAILAKFVVVIFAFFHRWGRLCFCQCTWKVEIQNYCVIEYRKNIWNWKSRNTGITIITFLQISDDSYCLVNKSFPIFVTSWTSPPCSSVHGISQARILEWIAISFSRESSWPRDPTHVSCLAGGFFTTEPPVEPRWFFENV